MSITRPLHVIVLAAGQGKRMCSDLPKVLHTVGGLPMIERVLREVAKLSPAAVHVVHGHGGDSVKAALSARTDIVWAHQAEQLGTGHAVAQAIGNVPADAAVIVCYGDVPLVRAETFEAVAGPARSGTLTVLTAELGDPTGYGRITRDADGKVTGIVEQRDASPEQRAITEINTGIVGGPADRVADWVARLRSDNDQAEYYLTDIVAMAAGDGHRVEAVIVDDAGDVEGVNDRVQLAEMERALQAREATRLMRAGAQLADPSRIDVRGTLEVGRDVFIDVNCVFEGHVILEDGARVGPFCLLRDTRVGTGAEIYSHTSIERGVVGNGAEVGPFARLRPGAELGARARVGNFVEMKNTRLGDGSKANHLTYLGDTQVGQRTNIGAGTITCNYDGANKHLTEIGDDVFVGSGTQLVAPVSIEAGATIGAGSTITSQVDSGLLAVSRARQRNISGWTRPKKGEKRSRP